MKLGWLISVLSLAVLIFSGCLTKEPHPTPQPVTFEQLFSNLDHYNGKDIIIEGFYFHGFEIIVLSENLDYSGYAQGHLIPKGEMLWVEGGIAKEVYDSLYEQLMMGPSERYGKIRIRGIFEYGEKYGHLGQYDYQIIPLQVEILPWSPS